MTLRGEFKQAKVMLRNCLQLGLNQQRTAQILNNLAYCSWQHSKQLRS